MSPTRAWAQCSKGSAGSSPTSAPAGVALRLLAQNDTAGAPHRMAAYLRIEAMANEVLGAFGYPWACLYDTRAHSRQTLHDAHQTGLPKIMSTRESESGG
jgi:hypothetical protein